MAELNPAWALENSATHHANVNRMMGKLLAGRCEGVVEAAALAVTQRGAGANMSVDVAKGSCLVFGDENEQQGVYGCVNDATVNVVIAAADATNPRRDLIVARVKDAFYSGATNAWALERVAGTPAASPADPTVPNNALVLARVAVAAAATSVVTGNITDLRSYLPLGVIPGNSARPPGTLYGAYSQESAFKPTPVAGQMRFDTDTGLLYVYNAAGAWVCITPQTSGVTTAETTGSATYAALTTAQAVTVQTGTKALVTMSVRSSNNAANQNYVGFNVSGATTVTLGTPGATANEMYHHELTGGANWPISRTVLVTGLTAGANVFTMRHATSNGTATFANRDLTVVGIP